MRKGQDKIHDDEIDRRNSTASSTPYTLHTKPLVGTFEKTQL